MPQGVPLRLPKPFSDQFSVRACSKTCSYTPSTTGAVYATSDAWRAEGRASHALCLAGSPME